MPKTYRQGGRVSTGKGPERGPVDGPAPRFAAPAIFGARQSQPFLRLVWEVDAGKMAGTLALRLLRALLPVAMLFVAS